MSVILTSIAVALLGITNILQTSMIRKMGERIDELDSEIRDVKIEMLEMRAKTYVELGELERRANRIERQNKGE